MSLITKILSIFKPARLENPECCYDCTDKCPFGCVLNRETCDNRKCRPGRCGCYTSS